MNQVIKFRKGDIVFAVKEETPSSEWLGLKNQGDFIVGIRKITPAEVEDFYKNNTGFNSAGETFLCPRKVEERLPVNTPLIVLKLRNYREWQLSPCSLVLNPRTGHEYVVKTFELSLEPKLSASQLKTERG